MTAAAPNDLARALRAFFADHLPQVRGTSPHTIRSYRDSLVLLLRFVATGLQRSVIQLDLDDLGHRRAGPGSRRPVRRRPALGHARAGSPTGQGGGRSGCARCGPKTADILRALLAEREREPQSDEPVFRNHRGMRLSRFGVRYLLRKYCSRAQATVPTLRGKRPHPNSMRHSTAVHLLRAGVDIVTISQWLGHASVTTTHRYATVDLDMKRQALDKARPTTGATAGPALWRTDASVLEWLEAL